jgi:hypothetical protein
MASPSCAKPKDSEEFKTDPGGAFAAAAVPGEISK